METGCAPAEPFDKLAATRNSIEQIDIQICPLKAVNLTASRKIRLWAQEDGSVRTRTLKVIAEEAAEPVDYHHLERSRLRRPDLDHLLELRATTFFADAPASTKVSMSW